MRAIWSGSLSFGLVNIPVKLYSGSEERELKFHLLHKEDLSPIRYAKVCRHEGKEVPYEDIVRGYEYQEGDYIVLTEDDFRRADPKKTKAVEIFDFAQEAEIDSKYYDAPYYLEPSKGAEKPYVLLREALKRSKKVGIGKFVLRKKEILCAVKPEGNIIMLNRLRFADQIRPTEELKVPDNFEVGKREIDLALKLIDELSGPFKPQEYKDTYTEKLEKVIAAKAEGRAFKPAGEEPTPTKVNDLMEILRQSLEREREKASHESE